MQTHRNQQKPSALWPLPTIRIYYIPPKPIHIIASAHYVGVCTAGTITCGHVSELIFTGKNLTGIHLIPSHLSDLSKEYIFNISVSRSIAWNSSAEGTCHNIK